MKLRPSINIKTTKIIKCYHEICWASFCSYYTRMEEAVYQLRGELKMYCMENTPFFIRNYVGKLFPVCFSGKLKNRKHKNFIYLFFAWNNIQYLYKLFNIFYKNYSKIFISLWKSIRNFVDKWETYFLNFHEFVIIFHI